MPDERKNGKVQSCALGRTQSGKDQLCIMFQCEDGELAPYYQLFESDQNLEFFEKVMKTLGWDPNAHGWRVEELHQSEEILGREASLLIEEDEYNGKKRRRVKYVNDPKGGTGLKEVMSPQDVATFGARLRARVTGQAVPVQRPLVGAPAVPDDQVPF